MNSSEIPRVDLKIKIFLRYGLQFDREINRLVTKKNSKRMDEIINICLIAISIILGNHVKY